MFPTLEIFKPITDLDMSLVVVIVDSGRIPRTMQIRWTKASTAYDSERWRTVPVNGDDEQEQLKLTNGDDAQTRTTIDDGRGRQT